MKKIVLKGTPSDKQKLLFSSRTKYTAYGGARGGGKSWALRRKLVLMCLHYPGLKCLIVRRSYSELRYNHILPLRSELGGAVKYSETQKLITFENGSSLKLGYLSDDGDTLQYQGLEFDIIALDEATQLTEYQFNILKACLRGTNRYPKRMYLTCNPGGIGHGWVKRLFIDRSYREWEDPDDYTFIQATVFDNTVLLDNDAEYVKQLQSLPDALRQAWLYGKWDV
ncbi:MAG: phage terminase large subunit, partial [Clostridia bacterium]|nr:phage terminase large subunit [Clostridia bacterium]